MGLRQKRPRVSYRCSPPETQSGNSKLSETADHYNSSSTDSHGSSDGNSISNMPERACFKTAVTPSIVSTSLKTGGFEGNRFVHKYAHPQPLANPRDKSDSSNASSQGSRMNSWAAPVCRGGCEQKVVSLRGRQYDSGQSAVQLSRANYTNYARVPIYLTSEAHPEEQGGQSTVLEPEDIESTAEHNYSPGYIESAFLQTSIEEGNLDGSLEEGEIDERLEDHHVHPLPIHPPMRVRLRTTTA